MSARTCYGADSDSQVRRNDDFVLVDLEGAPRSVMQISVVWQESNKPLQGTSFKALLLVAPALTHLGEFRRLFRPEETYEGRKPYHGDMELLLSTEVLVLPLTAVACTPPSSSFSLALASLTPNSAATTRVESFATFCHRQHFSQGVHYFTSSEYYDPQAGRVLSKPSQCLLVSPLRDRLTALPKSRLPVPSLTPESSSGGVSAPPELHSPVPASLPLPPTPCALAEERRVVPCHAPIAAPVAAATPDSPTAPGQEAADSPGARDTAAAPPEETPWRSRFTGELVPTAALTRMREEDAEVERRANEVMQRLKRRAAAIEELLGSPERAGEHTNMARPAAASAATSSAKKSPRSPTKKAKTRPMRTLQFAVVK